MSYSFELEIRRLLSTSDSLEEATRQIIQQISEPEFLNKEEALNSLYRFLTITHQHQALVSFLLPQLSNKKFKIPWGHFIEALSYLFEEVDPKLLSLIKKGLKDTEGKYEACGSQRWDHLIADMSHWRSQKRWEFSKVGPLRKKELLEELHLLRAQQLFDHEKRLLKKLEKMFPGDLDIKREMSEAQERSAFEVLGKHRAAKNLDRSLIEDDEKEDFEKLTQAFVLASKTHPELAEDFSIACLMMDAPEVAYEILMSSPFASQKIWLKAELQLRTKRYLDLLNELPALEILLASEPETFFATAFLRAQAMWGLGQKHMAIEVLESLLLSRPHYRSASLLLEQWRNG